MVVDVEEVVLVTAKPDNDTNPLLGLITNEVIVDKPKPVPDDVLTVVTKND